MVLSLENREGTLQEMGGKKEVREIWREEMIRIWYLLRYEITKKKEINPRWF